LSFCASLRFIFRACWLLSFSGEWFQVDLGPGRPSRSTLKSRRPARHFHMCACVPLLNFAARSSEQNKKIGARVSAAACIDRRTDHTRTHTHTQSTQNAEVMVWVSRHAKPKRRNICRCEINKASGQSGGSGYACRKTSFSSYWDADNISGWHPCDALGLALLIAWWVEHAGRSDAKGIHAPLTRCKIYL
jgi:hypothetical protein